MSEQSAQAPAGPPRARRPWSRLRDLPIWSKLGVIMLVPTLATIVVGTSGLIGHVDTYNNADRTRVLAGLAEDSGALVHHLQHERAAAVMLLGADGEEQLDVRSAAYSQVQQAADTARESYEGARTRLTDLPAGFRTLLDDIGGQLAFLPQLRSEVAGSELALSDAVKSYEELISGLVNIRDSAAQLSGETDLGDRMRAAAGIARAKEFLSRQRVVGHETLIRGAYHPQLRTAFIGTQTGQEQALEQFNAVATDDDRTLLEQTLEGPELRQSTNYQDYLDSLDGTALDDPPWDADGWDEVMAAHADLLREVEAHLDQEVVAEAIALRDGVTQRMLVETGALLAVLLLAVLLAWLVARSMVSSLRELRQGALSVAQRGLPQAVARLRDPSLSTQMSPAQVAGQIAEPLPVRSRDEVGQVTEAFNAVHLEAVRTAAEQASLRSSVSTMFVNLARRSQILVDRLIGHLDRLERGEEDPDRLAELFQLDHLATRMRRNDENLLVLAGADSTRVQREPATVIDVLRAAQSEVEHYTRIEFGMVERDVEVAAHAVNDLVHLVAELLDNATAFSPPDSPVTVDARRAGDHVTLSIADQGLGLSPDQFAEINERLATPPQVDVTVSRMMGLVVVSRLAARHGVRVELRRGAERGIVAEVALPAQVLMTHGLAGRGDQGRSAIYAGPELPPRPALTGSNGDAGAAAPPSPGLAVPAFTPLPAPPGTPSSAPPAGPISGPPASGPPASGPPASGPPASGPPASPPVSGAPYDAPVSGGPGGGGRRLPVWSDLTGAHSNGTEPVIQPSGSPLPRRRPGATQEAAPSDQPPLIPRQRPMEDPPATAEEPSATAEPAPTAEMSQQAPPAWPPLATPTPAAPPEQLDPTGQDDLAEQTGQAADETADRAEPDQPTRPAASPPAATGAGAAPYAPPAPPPRVVADETMELPIFNQLESAWFRTASRRPGPDSPDERSGAETIGEYAAATATGTTTGDVGMGEATRSTVPDGQSPAQADDGVSDAGWRTAADAGWRAASSLTDTTVEETTAAGLPKRRPMAQLVPGGVDTGQASPQRRSPEAVRGLLSAYHRGVQRGRTQGSAEDDSHSAQAGKEQGA